MNKKTKAMKITPNQSKRTFTIRKEYVKFRTLRMSKDEFEQCENYTNEDWKYFLRAETGNYYEVKK